MTIILNAETGQQEMHMPATIKSISADVKLTKPTANHPEGARIQWCKVDVVYPSGKTDTVDSTVWAKSVESLPDVFVPGAEIDLVTMLQGPKAGYSSVNLPATKRVDITQFDLSALTVQAVDAVAEEA